MCGIVGVVKRGGPPDVDLGPALCRLNHRGPDANSARTFVGTDSGCVLGHTRLRIIDLSTEADQPMSNETGDVWVTYNGEIYNAPELRAALEAKGHRFRSRSDTEVLVHLYEELRDYPEQLLQKLRGMFAFAIYDQNHDRLLLARDRLGIKPLYYAEANGKLLFSSEVRAAVATGLVSKQISERGLRSFLAWGSVAGPDTIFEDVTELPPATFLLWDKGHVRMEKWWEPTLGGADDVDRSTAVWMVRSALQDSVARHLVADRPVGIFLSSGVDSGAIATVAAELTGKIRGLTVTFPDAAHEGNEAALLANRLGADFTEVPVTGQEVAEELPNFIASLDQPTADGLNTWIVSKAAREAGLVVALSGVGGDELFGGYHTFRQVPLLATITALSRRVLSPGMGRHLARILDARYPTGRVQRALLSGPGYAEAYQAVRGLFTTFSGNLSLLDECAARGRTSKEKVMLLEMVGYMRNQLLRDTDQTAMVHALEVRAPLLDDLLIDVALSLPESIRFLDNKRLLSSSALLPNGAKKKGFTLPFDSWMRGPFNQFMNDSLQSDGSGLEFDERTLWKHFRGNRVHWSRPWAIAVLNSWLKIST